MIYLVVLTGLPLNIQFRQIMKLLNDVKKHKISYWVRKLPSMSSTDVNKVVIETYSKQDADKVVILLSGKTVTQDKNTYSCKVFIDSKCDITCTQNPFKKNGQQNTKLPKKKQLKNKESESLPTNLEDNSIIHNFPALPKFNIPISILIKEMNSLIIQHCHRQKELFLRTLRVQLRMRFTELFQGRVLHEVYSIPVPDLISTYRNAHSESTDEDFVLKTYNMVQVACWPSAETMSDGVYFEELNKLEDEEAMNINSWENSDNKTTMDTTDEHQEKSFTNDEDEWSVASWSDGSNDVKT